MIVANRHNHSRLTWTSSLAVLALLLTGAAAAQDGMTNSPDAPPRTLGSAPNAAPSAPPIQSAQAPEQNEDEDAIPPLPGMQVFEGTGNFVNSTHSKAAIAQKGEVTLDFTDADVRDVVRAIFGDILQRSYTIDAKVTGKITLKTGQPISKEAVLPALETALKINGAAINLTDNIYNVVPIADAQHHGQIAYGTDESQAVGHGIEIVPLQYVSAEEMQRIITPLVPESAIAQIDAKRNLMFLAGTEPERAAIRETIARFDVNYLKGMSFALIQPNHATAEILAGELDKIFGEANSPIAGLVRLVPIPRINSLLVITSRRNYLKEVQKWVGRLDVTPVTPDRRIYFYRLQNARARDVAEILSRLFGTNSSFVGSESTSDGQNAVPGPPPFAGIPRRTGQSSPIMAGASPSAPMAPNSPAPSAPQSASAPIQAGVNWGSSNPSAPQVVTDDSNNALIIRADAANYAAIEDVIRQMDTTPGQVMVEATIVEVTLNDTLKYGVEWYFKNGDQTFTMSPSGSVKTHFPGLGITYSVPDINLALSTLGSLTNVTVLSSPKILTLDNKAASIEVGDQIPIVTQTSVSTTTSDAPIVSSVMQRDTGVILSVTPRIGNSGIVYLDVSQEVSTSMPTTTSNIDSPTIQQRRIRSTVAVHDGATIALGGLMQRSENGSDSGVPYLKDIPLLGGLFSTKSTTRARTELLVFLTPHVIRNLPSALDATERLKKEMQDIRDALDNLPRQRVPRRPW